MRAGEVLVLLRPRAGLAAVAGRPAWPAEEVAPSLRRVRVPAGQERARAAALRADPDVLAASPNFRRRAQVIPDDPLFARQWAPQRIGAPSGWDGATATRT